MLAYRLAAPGSRLFPNQDTLPRGGFGNLIALPLQYEARQRGNRLFVDGNLAPYEDQWGSLASVRRLEPAPVENIAREAARWGQIFGVGVGNGDDDATPPWERPPSRRTEPAPDQRRLPTPPSAAVA